MKVFSIVLSIIAIALSICSLRRLHELDDAIFEYMKNEHNEKVNKEV